MAGLYDILANAQNGEAIERLSRQFNLTPQQTEEAVAALLPAISRGLKQRTDTPEGLGGLLGMMLQEQGLQSMYDEPGTAFGDSGRRAGNDALGTIFGSKDVSRAVADQAQYATGIGSAILKQMLPVIIGLILSGFLKNLGGGGAQGRPVPQPSPQPMPQGPGGGGAGGGGLGDILGEILRGRVPGQTPGETSGGGQSPFPFPFPIPDGQGGPAPRAPQPSPGPGGGGLGDILRDILGGGAGGGSGGAPNPAPGRLRDLDEMSRRLPVAGHYGEALFGTLLEPGHDVDRGHEQSIQELLDRMLGGRPR